MATPYIGEVRIVSWPFAPPGWAFCDGQTLPVLQNIALFSVIGASYGGNGVTTFALPNLQGRVPIHAGGGFIQGQSGGESVHTVTIQEMPVHQHVPVGSSATPAFKSAAAHLWAQDNNHPPYSPTPNTSMNPLTVSPAGGSQPHQNMPPYLVLNFIIALQGVFPSRT